MKNKKKTRSSNIPELEGMDLSKLAPTKEKKRLRLTALVSGIFFLLAFNVSEQIHSMIFYFLETQNIPAYTPIEVKNNILLSYIFFSIVVYCIILVIFRWIQYDKIKKRIKTISYVLGHIMVCFPLAFLALRGINSCMTIIFLHLPFTVWNIAWLITDLSLYLVIYKPITIAMEALADTYLKHERKNHSLEIYRKNSSSPEMVSRLIAAHTFATCYQAMNTNLKELKQGQFFVITQYGPFKKPRHHWHYDKKGNLIFRD